MPSWEKQACQKRTVSVCAITSLVVLVGLLMFVVYLMLSWQDIIGEHFMQDPAYDLNSDIYDDCRSKATVVTDKAMLQIWDTSTNFSQAWSNAGQKAKEPVHQYMEKRHSMAIYMYSDMMLQPVRQDPGTAKQSGKWLMESRSLYSSLSEAVQILKHSQVSCFRINYQTETLFHLNISDKLIRFSTFIIGSDGWNLTRNASCFEVYTCFGADITHYSALRLNIQVLIPPYEVFKATETDTQMCKVMYRLKSNQNCVYDRDSNMLHPISALPVEGFWLIFAIVCIVIACLLLPFVVVKVLKNHKKTAVSSGSSWNDSTYYPAGVVL